MGQKSRLKGIADSVRMKYEIFVCSVAYILVLFLRTLMRETEYLIFKGKSLLH